MSFEILRNFSGRARQNFLPLLLLCGLLTTGCVQIRLLTYPAEFHWLDKEDVQGTMHAMALSMNRLHALSLPFDSGADPIQLVNRQAEILEELTIIEELANSLDTSADILVGEDGKALPATNHLLLDEHIDEFMEQVLRARMLAEDDPPNYYGVGLLTGNCNACHRQR